MQLKSGKKFYVYIQNYFTKKCTIKNEFEKR